MNAFVNVKQAFEERLLHRYKRRDAVIDALWVAPNSIGNLPNFLGGLANSPEELASSLQELPSFFCRPPERRPSPEKPVSMKTGPKDKQERACRRGHCSSDAANGAKMKGHSYELYGQTSRRQSL